MIGFVGLSHLGIVSSIAAAAKGFAVTAYDPDAALCAALEQGRLPLFEPNLAELRAACRDRLRFTADATELRHCDLITLSQDVPTDDGNRSKLGELPERIEEVARLAPPDAVLVILSQVPPGFTRRISNHLRQARPDLTLHYQVETLIFGRAVERAMQPERFIVGCAEPEAPLSARYAGFLKAFECPILPMRYESAELAKIAINMCLVSSVTTANTLAELSEAIGADWSEIAPALKLDRRIGPHAYLSPGLGVAGGNLERDLVTVRTLAHEHGTDASIVDAWLSNSCSRRDWALRKLHGEVLDRIATPTIAIWGLAYKPDTASTKNSPALALLDALPAFTIRAHDPQVRLPAGAYPNVRQTESALDACVGADVLVVMTPWAEFGGIGLRELAARMRSRTLIDPFGALDTRKCAELGFAHHRLGVSSAAQSSVAQSARRSAA
jgi:UDPglucose 6-dehydrogenase